MQTKGLLFIPDISGYSRFITDIELSHSQEVMKGLIEILLDANILHFEVSELEGDAILFYKFGDSPKMAEMYEQVEKMFCAFHHQISLYIENNTCDCNACNSLTRLTLKIITHHGEFTLHDIRHYQKLIGKDVVVAHRLLKNDILGHEYWLVTDTLLNEEAPINFREWMQWHRSFKQTENGEIRFHFTDLGSLRKGTSV